MSPTESLTAEPAPLRLGASQRAAVFLKHSLLRFLLAGGLSTGVDIALLYVLHGTLHVQLTVATLISVIVSFVVNFTLNRVWSFGSVQPVGSQMVRYLILAGFNWVSTALLVSGLAAIGVFYLLARLITIAVNSVINYIAYKHWVFKSA